MEEIFEIQKSRVYVLPDDRHRILRCEGGYTMGNIAELADWVLIDEGTGDRYNLCQSHYFDSLYTDDGIPRYELTPADNPYGWAAVLRSEADIEADRAAIPVPEPPVDLSARVSVLETDKADKTEVEAITSAIERGLAL